MPTNDSEPTDDVIHCGKQIEKIRTRTVCEIVDCFIHFVEHKTTEIKMHLLFL